MSRTDNMQRLINKVLFPVFLALLVALLSFESEAHPGGTNADGCHTNRKTGEYHCHNRKPPVAGKSSYCHVLNNEYRCGYAKTTCEDLRKRFGGYCVQK